MNCTSFQNIINETQDPLLPGDAVTAHAEGCANCGPLLRERILLQGLLSDLPRVNAPDDFEWRLKARLHTRNGRSSRPFANGFRGRGFRIATASSFAILAAFVLIAINVNNRRQQANGQLDRVVAVNATRLDPSVASAFANLEGRSRKGVNNSDLPGSNVTGGNDVEMPKNSPGRGYRAITKHVTTADFALNNAVVLFGGNQRSDPSSNASQFVVAERNLKVMVSGAEGGTRTVSLKSVTFGSQQMMEHSRTVADLNNGAQGIW